MQSSSNSAPSPRPKRILVVEDDPVQAVFLRRVLEQAGFQVSLAAEGSLALRMLEDQAVDLVVSDIAMPGMDGYTMCRRIKEEERWARLPVILLTQLSDPESVLAGLAARADLYLTKPFARGYLLEKVNALLESARPVEPGGPAEPPFQIEMGGRTHELTASRRQMFGLLLATYENAIQLNRELLRTQEELAGANAELRRQQEWLRASEANLRSILEHSAEGFVILSEDEGVAFCNRAAERLLPAEAVMVRAGRFPLRLPADAGDVRLGDRVLAATVRPLSWEGRAARLVSLRDVTAERAAEQARELEQARLKARNAELADLATLDPLTQLLNRRGFADRLELAVASAQESGIPLSLLLIDLDEFKSYNDTFGHPAGDTALKILAELLRRSLRSNDQAGRHGGEEFVVSLPATPRAVAALVAERLREQVAAGSWPHRRVTVSIGVATLAPGQTAAELVSAADAALYQAKRSGRNQVALAEPGPARAVSP